MRSPAFAVPYLDATRLLPHLYIGGAPASARAVTGNGFGTLVLCAREVQPPALGDLQVLRCPLDDDPTRALSSDDWRMAVQTAERVCWRLRGGSRVLVTCAQGRNRSGLVCAIVMHLATQRRGSDCIRAIQRRRENALTNPRFVDVLVRRLG